MDGWPNIGMMRMSDDGDHSVVNRSIDRSIRFDSIGGRHHTCLVRMTPSIDPSIHRIDRTIRRPPQHASFIRGLVLHKRPACWRPLAPGDALLLFRSRQISIDPLDDEGELTTAHIRGPQPVRILFPRPPASTCARRIHGLVFWGCGRQCQGTESIQKPRHPTSRHPTSAQSPPSSTYDGSDFAPRVAVNHSPPYFRPKPEPTARTRTRRPAAVLAGVFPYSPWHPRPPQSRSAPRSFSFTLGSIHTSERPRSSHARFPTRPHIQATSDGHSARRPSSRSRLLSYRPFLLGQAGRVKRGARQALA